jgi:hypothetical protein
MKISQRLLTYGCALAAVFLLIGSSRAKHSRLAFGAVALCLLSLGLGCGGEGGVGGGGGEGVTPPTGGGSSPPGHTTITLTTSNAKVPAGSPFLVTATVIGGKPLTDTVTFYNFGTAVSGAPIANGQAQTGHGYINNPGIYQITASYSGDSQNQASSSAPLIQVLTGTFPVTIQGATGGDLHFVQRSVGVQ